jgi:hypothetical protein
MALYFLFIVPTGPHTLFCKRNSIEKATFRTLRGDCSEARGRIHERGRGNQSCCQVDTEDGEADQTVAPHRDVAQRLRDCVVAV